MRLVFVINGLYEKSGGVPKTILNRASFLVEAGYDVKIYTLTYQKDFTKIHNDWKKRGKINPKINIEMIFSQSDALSSISFKNTFLYQKIYFKYKYFINKKYSEKNDKYIIVKNNKSDIIMTLRKNGKNWFFIDHYSNNQVQKRVEFCNRKTKIIKLFSDGNRKNFSYFFIDNDKIITKIKVVNDKFNEVYLDGINFMDSADSYAYLFNKVISKNDCIFGEFRDTNLNYLPKNNLDYLISKINAGKKVCIYHNSHTDGTNVHPPFEKVLKGSIYNNHICLTNEQKEDIIKLVPNIDIDVLPNGIKKGKKYNVERNKNRIIVVSRVTYKKGFDILVEYAREIKKNNLDLYIDFYGFDYSDKFSISQKKIINDEELPLYFQGVVDNIGLEFQKSQFSLITARFEGFSMALYESIMNDTPVVTSHFMYGAKDGIREGENGFFINDFNDFKKAVDLINQNDFSGISETLSDFEETFVQKKWVNFIEKIEKSI